MATLSTDPPITPLRQRMQQDMLMRGGLGPHTQQDYVRHVQRFGACIGITAVLHTWGSAMTHHPHVHMIVPGGGIAPDGSRWISSRPAFLLPVRVLGKLFRRLFLIRLVALHDAGRLASSDRRRTW